MKRISFSRILGFLGNTILLIFFILVVVGGNDETGDLPTIFYFSKNTFMGIVFFALFLFFIIVPLALLKEKLLKRKGKKSYVIFMATFLLAISWPFIIGGTINLFGALPGFILLYGIWVGGFTCKWFSNITPFPSDWFGNKIKILHIDDDKFILNMFKIKFEMKEDFEVTSMKELPSNFLDKIADLGPGLIISDYVMPGLDGIEVLKAVKNDLRTKDIPFIFLTPDVFPKLLEEAKKYGAVGIINPGVTHPQEVVDEVTKILANLKNK